MADNINLNGPYDTKVPGYNEAADIQQALKLFLYGSVTPPSNQTEILSTSLAGHLKSLQDDIDALDARGIGSKVQSTRPINVPDGFVWVDQASAPTSAPQYAQAVYEENPPANPSTGSLWVDSGSSPLVMYVWSGLTWKAIGA